MGQMLKGLAIYLCPIIGRVKKATFIYLVLKIITYLAKDLCAGDDKFF